ncbi:uncharacterized protein [Argopecten irradians]|uniref:uncharacterized protein n=1 Tax=Argopecten irradians TaxID=31199 RepID=UPI0037139E2F
MRPKRKAAANNTAIKQRRVTEPAAAVSVAPAVSAPTTTDVPPPPAPAPSSAPAQTVPVADVQALVKKPSNKEWRKRKNYFYTRNTRPQLPRADNADASAGEAMATNLPPIAVPTEQVMTSHDSINRKVQKIVSDSTSTSSASSHTDGPKTLPVTLNKLLVASLAPVIP